MKKDRLRHDKDEVHNLDDLIEARNEGTSHIARDIDAFDKDIDIPEDTDVDEALTFPHPKNHKREEIDLMDTPHEEDMEDDQDVWDDSNMLPSDYSDDYDDALSVFPTDDEDALAEEQIHDMSHVRLGELSDEPTIERMPNVFTSDETTEEIQRKKGAPNPEEIGMVLAQEHTEEQARTEGGEAVEQMDREHPRGE